MAAATGPLRRDHFSLEIAVAAVLFLVVLFACYHDAVGDGDVWWHMAYGEQVLEGGSWSQEHDKWSWTEADGSWRYVSWIAGLVLYGSHASFGSAGPWIVLVTFYLTIAALFLHLAWTRRRRLATRDFLLLSTVFVAMRASAAHPKAEIFSVLFFAVTVWIYASARTSGRDRFWLLPIIFWLWMNAHGAGLVSYLLLGALVVGETIARRWGEGLPRRSYRRLLGFGALAIAVTAVNPEGPALAIDSFRALLTYTETDETLRIDALGTRWDTLFPATLAGTWKAIVGWTLILLFVTQVVSTLRRHRRLGAIDPTIAIAGLGFFVMAMQLSRAGHFYPLFVLMVFGLFDGRAGSDDAGETPPPTRARDALALVLLALVSLGAHFTTSTPLRWGGQAVERTAPVLESRFVREHELPTPLFNDYLSGGYLIWDLVPEYRVFVDPRYRPFSPELLDTYFAVAASGEVGVIEGFARRQGFRTALIDHRFSSRVARGFSDSDQWTLVYLGPVAAVFVRHDLVTPEVAAAIDENTDPRRLVEFGDPWVLESATSVVVNREPSLLVDLEHLLESRVSALYPRRAKVLTKIDRLLVRGGWYLQDGRRSTTAEMRGRFATSYRSGDLAAARFLVAAYLVEHPDDATMWYNRACIESLSENVGQAAVALSEALELGYDAHARLREDPDLEALRADPVYREVLARFGIEGSMAAR